MAQLAISDLGHNVVHNIVDKLFPKLSQNIGFRVLEGRLHNTTICLVGATCTRFFLQKSPGSIGFPCLSDYTTSTQIPDQIPEQVAGLLVFWIASTRTPGSPRVLRFTRLTSDGQRKIAPLVSDGVRVYFNGWLADGRLIIVQASVKGGDVIPLSVPLNVPFVQDISRDGTELLVANDEGPQGRSVWVQPIAGASPHRVGTVLTSWGPWGLGLDHAAFAADATHIIYSQGNDVTL